jgi:hypothetical protein
MVRSVVWQREKCWVAKNSTRLCVQYYRSDTSMRSVLCPRETWVASNPRKDAARRIKSVDARYAAGERSR